MSQKHPIIAVTGSSGAGTSTVKKSFEHIFWREKLTAAVVEGDSFHRYDREEMKKAVVESEKRTVIRSVILVRRPTNSKSWRRCSRPTGRLEQVRLVCISTMTKKPSHTTNVLAPSHRGGPSSRVRIYCFMRVCMGEPRAIPPMLPSTSICWWESFPSLILNGSRKSIVT